MIELKVFIKSILMTMLFFIVFTSNANAYLDLGTGSYLIQVVIASVLGGLFAVKLFWQKIKTSVKNIFSISKTSKNHKD